MKHYVVFLEWSSEGECGSNILGVAHSFEEANKIFNNTVEEEKEIAENNGWEIYEDSDFCFDAGEDGFYAGNHSKVSIEEVV